MNINASIIDQRINGIIEDHPEWLPEGSDLDKKKSAAFTLLCIATALDISMEESAELLTDGGQDAGVDGVPLALQGSGFFQNARRQGGEPPDARHPPHRIEPSVVAR